jgi:glycosyltransferase involved in cell wall biosynthesis
MVEISESRQGHGPRISVVIPVFNRPDLLDRCLSSLLQQDSPLADIEFLVCDDGSTVDLGPVVKRFQGILPQIKFLRRDLSKGPAAARNMGIRCSKASIIVTIDSDVICARDFLRRIGEALEEHPEWAAAQGAVFPVGACSSPIWDAPTNNGEAYLTGACAYRATALFQVGGFDEALLVGEDAAMAAEILKIGEFGFVREAIVYHPRRRVTMRTHWHWRRNWNYEMILARRYGFLCFPGYPAGRFPRWRIARAAVCTLPGGRFLEAVKYLKVNPVEAILACSYALFDVFCGLLSLRDIFGGKVPPRRNYLKNGMDERITGGSKSEIQEPQLKSKKGPSVSK